MDLKPLPTITVDNAEGSYPAPESNDKEDLSKEDFTTFFNQVKQESAKEESSKEEPKKKFVNDQKSKRQTRFYEKSSMFSVPTTAQIPMGLFE